MKIGVITYAGVNNLGDDWGEHLVLSALRERLPNADVERWTEETRYDVVASGCGTLLDEADGDVVRRLNDALDHGAQVALVGTGMSDPRHIQATEGGRARLNRVLNVALPGSWRRGVEAPCSFWLEGVRRGEPTTGATVGVNVGETAFSCIPDVTQRVAETVKRLRAKGVKVTPVAACTLTDEGPLRQVFPRADLLVVDGSEKARAQLRKLGVLLSLRGHLGVYATVCGLRVVQVEFSTKVRDMYARTEASPRFVGEDDDWTKAVVDAKRGSWFDTERAAWLADGAVRERVDMLAQSIAEMK